LVCVARERKEKEGKGLRQGHGERAEKKERKEKKWSERRTLNLRSV
jgi:hypothetical protein